MSIINRVKDLTNSAVDSSRERIEAVRDQRRRNALLAELGELTYRKQRGRAVDETAIDRVVAELDASVTAADAGLEPDDGGESPGGDDDTAGN